MNGAPAEVCGWLRLPAGARLVLMVGALATLAGCGAPAPPQPPSTHAPNSVANLAARQAGSGVVLRFALPQESTNGASLTGPWRVEIYRRFGAASAPVSGPGTSSPPAQTGTAASSAAPAYSLDAAALAGHQIGDTIAFTDSLGEAEFQMHRGEAVHYSVRTSAGGAWSAISNEASVTLVAPPAPARDVAAEVAGGVVTLHWTPSPSAAESYIVYREALPAAGTAAGPPVAVGTTNGSSYSDRSVQGGKSYRYFVRALEHVDGNEVESADSSAVSVVVPEMVNPSPPEGVEGIAVLEPTGSLEVDLSWAISGAGDLAGYNVYRSERPEERGVRLNRQPIAAPAFRDTTVVAGHSYHYSVTAVGPAGNESAPSTPIVVSVPRGDGGSR